MIQSKKHKKVKHTMTRQISQITRASRTSNFSKVSHLHHNDNKVNFQMQTSLGMKEYRIAKSMQVCLGNGVMKPFAVIGKLIQLNLHWKLKNNYLASYKNAFNYISDSGLVILCNKPSSCRDNEKEGIHKKLIYEDTWIKQSWLRSSNFL